MTTQPPPPERSGKPLVYRLYARSHPAVVHAVDVLVSRIGTGRRVSFRGRKFSNEAFINALCCHLLSLPEAEQEAILAAGTRLYEEILGDDTPGIHNGPPPAPAAPVPLRSVTRDVTPPAAPAPAPARRKKAGGR